MVERREAPVEICQACQRCCNRLSVGVNLPERLQELMAVHYGREVTRARFIVHHRCPHLDADGLCDLWKDDPALDGRPAICQEFMCEQVENPDILFLDVEGIK
jgi:Fe-S-cluster containining protein